jgi:hypothetical protein
MDSAWFMGEGADAVKQQEWFRGLATGKSIRQLDLPIPLTKRMARCILSAPPDYTINRALRWGQVIGLGGNARLVQSILNSRIGASFEANEFWQTVIQWLIQNPQVSRWQVAPLIDFIHHKRFEPQEIASATDNPLPGDPDFAMKGRTATSLLRKMSEWHAELRKPPAKQRELEWAPSGIGPFEWTESIAGSNDTQRWTIIELANQAELFNEGQTMRHCVARYDQSCAAGHTSIWSLGVELSSGRRRRVLTIEVANSKTICQIRGRANRLPKESELVLVRRWATQEQLAFSTYLF